MAAHRSQDAQHRGEEADVEDRFDKLNVTKVPGTLLLVILTSGALELARERAHTRIGKSAGFRAAVLEAVRVLHFAHRHLLLPTA